MDLASVLASRRRLAEASSLVSEGLGSRAPASTPGGGSSVVVSAANRAAADRQALLALGSVPPRAECGYAGIQNAGATCYLNSLLQSMFCTADFRRELYRFRLPAGEAGSAGGINEAEAAAAASRSVTQQLQTLFAELELSARQAVFTSRLTKSFGWGDGGEAYVQNDVTECAAVLFEALAREAEEASSSLASFIRSNQQGCLEYYTRCKGCGYTSTRREAFTSLQLPLVKGAANSDVSDALQAYLSPETLDGDNKYACDCCMADGKGKQEAERGIRLPSTACLPPCLFLALNRFEFDYNTMGRRKLSDKCTPLETLDMGAYTAATTDAGSTSGDGSTSDDGSSMLYDLAGVLMHTGAAGAGHYFAYLKVPASPSAATTGEAGSNDGTRWLHFNDSSVQEIPRESVPRVLFGRAKPQAAAAVVQEAAATPSSSSSSSSSSASSSSATATATAGSTTGSTLSSSSSPLSTANTSTTGAMAVPTGPGHVPKPPPLPTNTNTSASRTSAPLSLPEASSGAYLLIYRRRDTLPAHLHGSSPSASDGGSDALSALLPADTMSRIREDNERYLAARREWEAEQRRVRLRVYYNYEPSTDTTTSSSGSTSGSGSGCLVNPSSLAIAEVVVDEGDSAQAVLEAATAAVVAATTTAGEAATGFSYRLRLFSPVKGVALAPLDVAMAGAATAAAASGEDTACSPGSSFSALRAVGLNSGSCLLLERRSTVITATGASSSWVAGSLPLRVKLFNPFDAGNAAASRISSSSSSLSAEEVLLHPGQLTVGQLRFAAAQALASRAADLIMEASSSSFSSKEDESCSAATAFARSVGRSLLEGGYRKLPVDVDGSMPMLRLVVVNPESEDQPPRVLVDDSAPIVVAPIPGAASFSSSSLSSSSSSSGAGSVSLAPGDEVHCELLPCSYSSSANSDDDDSPLVSLWEEQANTIVVAFNVPAEFQASAAATATATVSVDQRSPLSSLRRTIADRLIELNPSLTHNSHNAVVERFKIRRPASTIVAITAASSPSAAVGGLELKDETQSIAFYGLSSASASASSASSSGGSAPTARVVIEAGRPLKPDEFDFKLTLLCTPRPHATQAHSALLAHLPPLIPLGNMAIRASETTGQALKEKIFRHLSPQGGASGDAAGPSLITAVAAAVGKARKAMGEEPFKALLKEEGHSREAEGSEDQQALYLRLFASACQFPPASPEHMRLREKPASFGGAASGAAASTAASSASIKLGRAIADATTLSQHYSSAPSAWGPSKSGAASKPSPVTAAAATTAPAPTAVGTASSSSAAAAGSSVSSKLADGKEIVIQVLPFAEQCREGDLLLLTSMWAPSASINTAAPPPATSAAASAITAPTEALFSAEATLRELATTMAARVGLATPASTGSCVVRIAKPWAWQLQDPGAHFWTLKWVDIDINIPHAEHGGQLVSSMFKAGDAVVLCSKREFDDAAAAEAKAKGKGGDADGDGSPSGAASAAAAAAKARALRSGGGETGFRIFTPAEQIAREAAKRAREEEERKEAEERSAQIKAALAAKLAAAPPAAPPAGDAPPAAPAELAASTSKDIASVTASTNDATGAGIDDTDTDELSKYLKLLRVGMPVEAVKQRMRADGLDPEFLTTAAVSAVAASL